MDGWDPVKTASFDRYIIDSTVVSGLMVVHKGKIVYDFGDLSQLSRSASLRKSVLAILFGKYVESGTIDLEETIGELGIDDIGGVLPIEKRAKIKHLLAARSGIYKDRELLNAQDLPQRGSKEPGTYWYYDSWGFNALGHIFEQKTGNNIYDEIESQLAIPLGFQDWDRSAQHKIYNEGISHFPQYQMWFSTRDMARIGYMMLQDGRWAGKQIVSMDWKEEMLKERTDFAEIVKNKPANKAAPLNLGYGYLWWLLDSPGDDRFEGAYMAQGVRGQVIAVFPAIQTVLSFVTTEIYKRWNSYATILNIVKKVPSMYDPEWEDKYVTTEKFNPINLNDDQIKPILGQYKRGKSPPVTIKKGEEGLSLVFPNGNTQTLIPISENKFVLKDQFIVEGIYKSVRFQMNEDGKVDKAVVQSNENFSLKKLD